jgi:hypothetical protein
MERTNEEKINWLKEVCPDFSYSCLKFRDITNPSNLNYIDFYTYNKSYIGNLDTKYLKGTKHIDYSSSNCWVDFFLKLKY